MFSGSRIPISFCLVVLFLTGCAENLGPGSVEDASSQSTEVPMSLPNPNPAPAAAPLPAPSPAPAPAPAPAPSPAPAPMADYQISAVVLAPATVKRGSPVAASADFYVKNGGSGLAVLFQIVDANYNQVALVTHEGQSFSPGQTRVFQASLSIPANLPAGTYYLSVGLFNSSYSLTLDYKNRALEVQVLP